VCLLLVTRAVTTGMYESFVTFLRIVTVAGCQC